MTRNLMAVAAAVALLGGGYGTGSVYRGLEHDEETEEKVRRAREAQAKESEELHQRLKERRRVRSAEEERWRKHVADANEMLRNGIEPTTGHPISRQRRRALNREGFRFASGTEAQRATTVKQGVVHDGPVPERQTPITPCNQTSD